MPQCRLAPDLYVSHSWALAGYAERPSLFQRGNDLRREHVHYFYGIVERTSSPTHAQIHQDRGGLVHPPLTISPARWPRQLLVDVPGGETLTSSSGKVARRQTPATVWPVRGFFSRGERAGSCLCRSFPPRSRLAEVPGVDSGTIGKIDKVRCRYR